jgi:hypothetical protein
MAEPDVVIQENHMKPLSPRIAAGLCLSLAASGLVLVISGCGSTPGPTAAGGRGGGDGGGGSGGSIVGGTGGTACISAPPFAQLPRARESGAKATAIAQALDAIMAAQIPPLAPLPAYAIASLGCSNGTQAACSFELKTGGAQPLSVTTMSSSSLAEQLFNALKAAGSTSCAGLAGKIPGGGIEEIFLENVSVSASDVQFEDASQFKDYFTQNVVAHGADAQGVVAAFKAAGIDDCDTTRKIFIICNGSFEAPSCGYQWMKQGNGEAVHSCGGLMASAGGDLRPDAARAIWLSLLTAAQHAGFESTNGPVAQTSTINARFFVLDGPDLRFSLNTGVARPPGP